jgi:hypothetical protein
MEVVAPTRKGEQRHEEGYTQPGRVVAAGLVCLNARAFGMIGAPTGEGRERAKARGVKMGRRPKLTDHQRA